MLFSLLLLLISTHQILADEPYFPSFDEFLTLFNKSYPYQDEYQFR